MMQPNRGLYPPGGYTFRERDGMVLQSSDWSRLSEAVTMYRKRRGWPLGDAWADICARFCGSYPSLCRKGWAGAATTDPVLNGFAASVSEWLSNLFLRVQKGAQIEVVPEAEARKRAAICSKCPMNRPWLSCLHCQKPTEAIRWKILRGKPHCGAGLGGCAAFQTDLYVAVSLVSDGVPCTGQEGAPKECWKR